MGAATKACTQNALDGAKLCRASVASLKTEYGIEAWGVRIKMIKRVQTFLESTKASSGSRNSSSQSTEVPNVVASPTEVPKAVASPTAVSKSMLRAPRAALNILSNANARV